MRTIFLTAFLCASFVACSASKYETCDGVTITPATANIQVLAAGDPFYCKEMEEVFDIDAKEYVNGFVGGRLSFVKAFKVSYSYVEGSETTTPECTDLGTDDIPISYPEEIIIGPLLSCTIGKTPPNTKCADTFSVTFSTEDGGWLRNGMNRPITIDSFFGNYNDQKGTSFAMYGCGGDCIDVDGKTFLCGFIEMPEQSGVSETASLLYEWHAPMP